MKVHWHQLERAVAAVGTTESDASDIDLFRSWLPNIKFVFLRRKDGIRRAISHYRAEQSDRWWLTAGEALSQDGQPADLEEIDWLRRLSTRHEQSWRDFFRRAAVQPLELTYEQMASDPARVLFDVLRFIGVDTSQVADIPPPRLQRQADGWTDRTVHDYITWKRSTGRMEAKHYGTEHRG
jgi:LPS sulfotransferase NodH